MIVRRLEQLFPWVFLWLPVLLALGVPFFLVVQGMRSMPQTPRSIVGEIPAVPLSVLTVPSPVPMELPEDQRGGYNPFLPPAPSHISGEEVPPRERIALSSVFILEGRRLCLINGAPYGEGESVGRVVVKRIEPGGIVVQRSDGEEVFVEVGAETDI